MAAGRLNAPDGFAQITTLIPASRKHIGRAVL